MLKTFFDLTMHMVQLGSYQEQETSTAKILRRCRWDPIKSRKQNAREENHLVNFNFPRYLTLGGKKNASLPHVKGRGWVNTSHVATLGRDLMEDISSKFWI